MANDSPKNGSDSPRKADPFFMDPKEIKRLLGIISTAGAMELELEDKGAKLRIRMPGAETSTEYVQVPSPYPAAAYPPFAPPQHTGTADSPGESDANKPKEPELPEGGYYITAPLVGTFYRSPSPDAEPFVKVGSVTEAESVVCIIEAMKVMNEIKSEGRAKIVKILVENGEPVEYGQPLMVLVPA